MKMNYKRVMWVGFAFLLIQAFWIAYDAIVPLMLVNKFGMNHTVSGIIMALDNVLAVFMLPLFGSLSDRSHSRMGRRKPYVLVGTIVAAVAFFGLSFVDHAQFVNLGEQVQMPGEYASTELSEKAQSYFWESNYTIRNNEYSLSNSDNNNKIGEELPLNDYVAEILYGKKYADLTVAQKDNCRDWYVSLDLSASYVYEGGEYKVYKLNEGGGATLLTFGDTVGETEADVKDAKKVNASNSYSVLVSSARSVYAAEVTKDNPATLALFMCVLLVTLVAMAVFRSPAVALMPDVVVRSNRSKGNAVINLMGMVGGILILGAGMIFGTDKVANQIMSYTGYIGCVSALMIISLIIFMVKVKEPQWAAEMLEDQKAIDAKEAVLEKQREEKEREEREEEAAESAGYLSEIKLVPDLKKKGAKEEAKREEADEVPATGRAKKNRLSGAKLASLILLLASVAFWYMGYNAVTSKYSLYSINVLGKPYNLVLIVAQVVGIISFLPIGLISSKVGRKPVILIGVLMLAGAFAGATGMTRNSPDWVVYLLFSIAGMGWAAINVNSFPMVVELAKEGDVGRYTGYYYTASMAAQIITPTLSGFIMDLAGSMAPLFIYGTVFVMFSFLTMLFVRHGDSKPAKRSSALEYLEGAED